MKTVLFFLFFLISASSVGQEIVLSGTPSKTIEIDKFGDRRTFSDPAEIELRITKDGENYYWASRGDILLAVASSGIYTTYIAVDGSGYLRTINETAREVFLAELPDNVVGLYTYFEHLSNDLTSKIIYGR